MVLLQGVLHQDDSSLERQGTLDAQTRWMDAKKRDLVLPWFWDPDEEWLLPVRCPHCCLVISLNETSNCLDRQEQVKAQIQIPCNAITFHVSSSNYWMVILPSLFCNIIGGGLLH